MCVYTTFNIFNTFHIFPVNYLLLILRSSPPKKDMTVLYFLSTYLLFISCGEIHFNILYYL